MNTNELIRQILLRLWKRKLLVLGAGVAVAMMFFFYAKSSRPVYTAKATIFPLNSNMDNGLNSNTLSGILGLGEATKTFSNEAAINIIELALSRYVRESVASARLSSFGNKTIAELLLDDRNSNEFFLQKGDRLPADSISAAIIGGELIRDKIVAKMSKNGLLELSFSHPNRQLLTPVSSVLIDKISQFYIDLKIRKAKADYYFTVKKIDSLDAILNNVDQRAIRMQHTTLFTPDKLEYEIPKERINADKQRYLRQRDISLNNQEEALWRLQKQTPIISVLDKPTEPFLVNRPPALLYGLTGFIIGCLITAFILVYRKLYEFLVIEIHRSINTGNP